MHCSPDTPDNNVDMPTPRPWTTPRVITAEARNSESGNGSLHSDFNTSGGGLFSS